MEFLLIFKALGDETRLRIINLLLQSQKELCVCEMTDALLIPQYQVSRHLTILKYIGLVQSRKVGTYVYYHVNTGISECVQDLLAVIKKHFGSKYREDLERINQRLAQRRNGLCVIGYATSQTSDKQSKND